MRSSSSAPRRSVRTRTARRATSAMAPDLRRSAANRPNVRVSETAALPGIRPACCARFAVPPCRPARMRTRRDADVAGAPRHPARHPVPGRARFRPQADSRTPSRGGAQRSSVCSNFRVDFLTALCRILRLSDESLALPPAGPMPFWRGCISGRGGSAVSRDGGHVEARWHLACGIRGQVARRGGPSRLPACEPYCRSLASSEHNGPKIKTEQPNCLETTC